MNNAVKKIWGETGTRQWNNWRWQIRNRLTSVAQLMPVLPMRPRRLARLEAVARHYPFCVTPYYFSLCETGNEKDIIRKQFLPDKREMLDAEMKADPLGEKHFEPVPGLLHRYHNRVVFVVTNECAMRCRHCTRKNTLTSLSVHGVLRRLPAIIKYVKQQKKIREVIISGGDPLLLENSVLDRIMGKLRLLKNVEVLRLGTRIPVILPMRIDAELCACLKKHRPLWINTQFNHPREITPEAEQACRRLQEAGLPVSNQAVLLRGVNDSLPALKNLCNGLQRIMVRPYYVFQCDGVRGTKHFGVPLGKAAHLARRLRSSVGGLSMPLFVADIPGRKNKIPLEMVCKTAHIRFLKK